MKKSALILLTLATMSYADFIRDAERGVVTDNKTKLVWQDDYSNGEDDSITYTSLKWTDALLYCHNLALDGGGWRLPNINELKSIIVDKAEPTIDEVFEYTKADRYYSSTTLNERSNHAWLVNFDDATIGYSSDNNPNSYQDKSVKGYVRCIKR